MKIYQLLPNQTQFTAEVTGDVQEPDECLHVLYVLEFAYNILYVSALLKNQRYSVTFANDHFVIPVKLKLRRIWKVETIDDLYMLYISQVKVVDRTFSVKQLSSIWHQRLGHPSITRMKDLLDIVALIYLTLLALTLPVIFAH